MVIFTSICANYLPKAMVLADSIKRVNSEIRFMLCLLERTIHCKAQNYPNFDHVVLAKDLGFKDFQQFIFKHSIVEASTAVKAQAFKYMFATYPDQRQFVYLDPDIVVMSDIIELYDILATHDIVLTPQMTIPEKKSTEYATFDAVRDNELCALKYGVYNLGFLGVRRSRRAEEFIDWWASRLNMFCYDDIPNGIFTDQKWMNLAPGFFDIFLLKHPGYNVAPWNLSMRKITQQNQCFFSNDEPLRFLHFSGFDSGANEAMVNKYVPNHADPIWKLRDTYLAALTEHGQDELGKEPWSYEYFASGEKIEKETRVFFRKHFLHEKFADPFQESNQKIQGIVEISTLQRNSFSTLFAIDMMNNLQLHQLSQPIILAPNNCLSISGWAVDDVAQNLAGGVYLNIDEKLFPARYGIDRIDVAEHFHVPSYRHAGFEAHIPFTEIGTGSHTLSLHIIAADHKTYCPAPAKIIFEIKQEVQHMPLHSCIVVKNHFWYSLQKKLSFFMAKAKEKFL